MTKDCVMGVPFYRFYYDENKIDEVLWNLKKLPYRDNDTNWIWEGVRKDGAGGSNLHTVPCFAELFEWMSECMVEVSKDLNIPNKMVVNSSWCHLNAPGEFIYDHIHPNCFISSNYYASGKEEDTTVFVTPNPYFHQSNIRPCGDGDKEWTEKTYYLVHEEPTEPGKFLAFPPQIHHYSRPNTDDNVRITIAANWFPTGLINCGDVSHLNIEVL